MISLAATGPAVAHPADAVARSTLRRVAAETGLAVAGGGLLRTSSRFCLGVEHGDYNGTELFGLGTDRFLWLAWRNNERGVVRLFSANEPQAGVVAFPVGDNAQRAAAMTRGWARFPLGAAAVLRQHGLASRRGLDLALFGNIPGGGMSRSAALSIGLLLVLAAANGHDLTDRMALARLAQAVENDHVGSPCGLLDPLMICHARRGFGTHYLPRTNAVHHVPLGGDPERLRLLCLDTGRSRHGLATATYPQRRRECEQFAATLGPEFGITCLADVRSPELLATVLARHEATQPQACARLRYLQAAQQRLDAMLAAWRLGDLAGLGSAFRADGHGLRDLYCISGPELETLCDIVRTVPGVLGERMLGGGDCGTAGALVLPEAVEAVRTAVATAYPRAHPRYAEGHAVHECRSADGIAALSPL